MRWTEKDGEVIAQIYRHSDGYPDGQGGVIADLKKFVKWLTGDPQPRPIHDIEYASANWIYWNKKQMIEELELSNGWEKLGYGITPIGRIHGNEEYLYVFDGETIKVSDDWTRVPTSRSEHGYDTPMQRTGTANSASTNRNKGGD